MCPGGFHPYAIKLQSRLGKKAIVDQRGISGEFTNSMIERLPIIMKNATSTYGYKYNTVIILGGTNDLSGYQTETANSIFSRLEALYKIVLADGAKLLVVSVPESRVPQPDYIQLRHDVNKLIKEYYTKHQHEGVRYLDLETEIPYNATGLASSLWSFDGLHMTALGYDNFGSLVFDSIRDWIR